MIGSLGTWPGPTASFCDHGAGRECRSHVRRPLSATLRLDIEPCENRLVTPPRKGRSKQLGGQDEPSPYLREMLRRAVSGSQPDRQSLAKAVVPLDDDLIHLIEVVADGFASTGEWPQVEALRHQLDKIDDELDVIEVARRMPSYLGGIDLGYHGRIHLTLHGLALSDRASRELEDAVAVVRLSYARFREAGPGASVTSAELGVALALDELRLVKVWVLIQSIPGLDGGGGSNDRDWHRILTSEITRLKRVETVDDLLARIPTRRGY